MIDLEVSAENVLREGGYKTYRFRGKSWSALAFEDICVFGFVSVFPTAVSLLEDWQGREKDLFAQNALAFRAAGEKSWNLYNVLLTPESTTQENERRILRLDEDLRYARKLARAGVSDSKSLQNALLPLLPVSSRPALENSDYEARLRSTLGIANTPEVVRAFFGDTPADDLPKLMMGQT